VRAALLTGVALLLAGCGEEAGTGGGGTETGAPSGSTTATGDAPACGPLEESFTEPTCGACAEASCCSELGACEALPCAPLDACLASSCPDACGTITDGLCGTALTTLSPTCDACVESSCCAELGACAAAAACSACLADAGGAGCATDPLLAEMEACFASSCADVCDG
jgi:hypothetical protein